MVEVEVRSFQTGPKAFPVTFRSEIDFSVALSGEPMFDMKPAKDEQGTFKRKQLQRSYLPSFLQFALLE